MVVVRAKGNRIKIFGQEIFDQYETRTEFIVGNYKVFLTAKGKDYEIKKIEDMIKETRKTMRRLKRDGDPYEKYYNANNKKHIERLKKDKEKLMNIPEEEIEEIVVEFSYSNGQLKVVRNGENIKIDNNKFQQELFFFGNLTTLSIRIVKNKE
jgi:hypothetical protein